MFTKFRIMFKLHTEVQTWENFKAMFPNMADVKLYRKLNSLSVDKYIEPFVDNDLTCYRQVSVNSFRDYCFMLTRRFVRFWYDFVMVIGSCAAIGTLILTLQSL